MEKGESSKRSREESIYGVLVSDAFGNITSRTDILTTGQIARGLPELRPTIEEEGILAFGSPSLL